MLSPITINNSAHAGSKGEAESEFSSQNFDTDLGRETMLQLLQSRQRVMRAQLEGLSAQSGMNLSPTLQNTQSGMFSQAGLGPLLQNDNISQDIQIYTHQGFRNDGSIGFHGGFSQGGLPDNLSQLTNSVAENTRNSSQQFMGGFGDEGCGRGMSISGDAQMEDELLRLLLARRQRRAWGNPSPGLQVC